MFEAIEIYNSQFVIMVTGSVLNISEADAIEITKSWIGYGEAWVKDHIAD